MNALVPTGDEGRAHAAISLGERLGRYDPGISEWGNLAGFIPSRLAVNK